MQLTTPQPAYTRSPTHLSAYPGDALDHIAFEVTDLDVTLRELSAKGIRTVGELKESPNSKWTYLTDPDGIWIEIFQKKR